MKYIGYAISDVGKVRKNNEDNMYLNGQYRTDLDALSWEFSLQDADTRPGGQAVKGRTVNSSHPLCTVLAAVYDGVGGAEKGEVASFLSAQEMNRCIEPPMGDGLYDYIRIANAEILRAAQGQQMGSTYVGLVIRHDLCWFNNVGDSRGYLFRNGRLKRMTHDHNMVMELVEEGILTKEQAAKHPARHAIYQFLGMKEEDALMEPYEHPVFGAKAGDYFLLCSDGLTDMLDEEEIVDILDGDMASEPDLSEVKEKAARLVEEALKRGGRDNVTVILILALTE